MVAKVTKQIVLYLIQLIGILRTAFSLSNRTTLKFGIILMTESDKPFDMRRITPAIMIAFEKVEAELDIDIVPVLQNYTGSCPWDAPVGRLSELYHDHNVHGVIGPACSQGLESAGRLAQYLKMPMVSGLGDLLIREPFLGDMYTTLTLLSYNLRKLSYSMSAIMDTYGWTHTAIIYDVTYVFFDLAGSNLVTDFRDIPIMERPYDIPFVPSKVQDYGDLLLDAKLHARVFIIFCDSDMLRDILYKATLLGMADGEYVFITMELFPSDWLGFYTKFLRGDEKDAAVTKAYESVLILTIRQPDSEEYLVFAEEVKRRAKTMFDFEFGQDESVNYFITAFYDSAIYLAMAYQKTLQEGGDINDGIAVAQKLWNSSFPGITGPVAIDADGNRIADFDLLDMKSPDTKEFQLVGRFRGATQVYSPTPGLSIVWPNGKPADRPPCGFNNELCIPPRVESNTKVIIAASVSVLLTAVVVMVVVGYLYRKIRIEQEIGKKGWMVSLEEIKLRKERMNDSFMSKSCLSINIGSKNFIEETQIFTQTGYCRGHTVALKRLDLHSIELDRKILIEFRQMQLLSHTNLAKFVGACVEPGNMIILMEYCPRGSLQDMLENDSIELDWSFRYSLITDIIKGMLYLHTSQISVHGRLTSTNCVIDSRFCLKLTDYGLPTIFTKERQMERKKSNRVFNPSKLLWTAPEHLRNSDGTIGVSQKGDVYSFGIILQEISQRSAPYDSNNLSAEEIINRLSDRNRAVIHPIIPEDTCSPPLIVMMNQCWAEYPKDRPSFDEIDEAFRKMRAGKSSNIMDNLLQRMSQYADNLEALAAERTKKYLEEKQKAEELLHRLLPPSVAKQLEIGNAVIPETFECVTIYFSDIVGFTSLAAMSSPIEVVDFLNDLYTAYDSTISKFDVYKVETIGDAYMVVSGLPERNGDKHVTEVCNMSLMLLHVVRNFKLRHIPDEQVRIRIGIHSGPVVAGVVGLTMPRYCLFGDTVNTASRMESTSEPLRIHLSNATKVLLERYPGYSVDVRGEIQVKGKGSMLTYWLNEPSQRQSVIIPPEFEIPGTSC